MHLSALPHIHLQLLSDPALPNCPKNPAQQVLPNANCMHDPMCQFLTLQPCNSFWPVARSALMTRLVCGHANPGRYHAHCWHQDGRPGLTNPAVHVCVIGGCLFCSVPVYIGIIAPYLAVHVAHASRWYPRYLRDANTHRRYHTTNIKRSHV